nr:DUF6600 domain-containing protein [uncultured Holophaga sp.]
MSAFDRRFLPLALLLPTIALVGSPAAAQTDQDADDYAGEAADRYAEVRVLEGEATVLKGDVTDALTRSTPIGEGDVVESHGRGILQLGDGSRVAFGEGTRFTVATLFADRDGDRQVLLKLESGRLRIQVAGDPDTRFRVDSPLGGASFGAKADVSFEVGARGLEVRVFSGRATAGVRDDREGLYAGEVITLSGERLSRVRDFDTYDLNAFESWSGPRLAWRQGADLDKVPREIRPFADELEGQGNWVYVGSVGAYCWQPRGVSPDWRPYWRGHWASYPGGMTWVSAEPWGFVTHHYGRWGWTAALGWYWIPGIQYAPAWVAWQDADDSFGWAPLGYYDEPCTWGYGAWGGGYCWNVVSLNFLWYPHIDRHINPGWRQLPAFGPRPHRPGPTPWRRSPVMVRPNEFRDPALFRRVVSQPELRRDRLRDYARSSEQATGRTVRRFATPSRVEQPADRPQGFADRERQFRRVESPDRRGAEGVRPNRGGTPQPERGGVVQPQRSRPVQEPDATLPPRRTRPQEPMTRPRNSSDGRSEQPSSARPAAVERSQASPERDRVVRERSDAAPGQSREVRETHGETRPKTDQGKGAKASFSRSEKHSGGDKDGSRKKD